MKYKAIIKLLHKKWEMPVIRDELAEYSNLSFPFSKHSKQISKTAIPAYSTKKARDEKKERDLNDKVHKW